MECIDIPLLTRQNIFSCLDKLPFKGDLQAWMLFLLVLLNSGTELPVFRVIVLRSQFFSPRGLCLTHNAPQPTCCKAAGLLNSRGGCAIAFPQGVYAGVKIFTGLYWLCCYIWLWAGWFAECNGPRKELIFWEDILGLLFNLHVYSLIQY